MLYFDQLKVLIKQLDTPIKKDIELYKYQE